MGCEQRFGAQQTSKCKCRSPLVELTLLLLNRGRKHFLPHFAVAQRRFLMYLEGFAAQTLCPIFNLV